MEDLHRAAKRREASALFAVGIGASVSVYLGHDWFHQTFLPALGVRSSLGDALGGLLVVVVAHLGQRIASLALYRDGHYGLLDATRTLQGAVRDLSTELDEVGQLARRDRLTGCWNRRGFEEIVDGEIARMRRHDNTLTVLLLDIDHFKRVNDTHGHLAGDRVLAHLAELLRSSCRPSDSVTRWGGEEFLVLCPNTRLDTAIALAERLRTAVSSTEIVGVGRITVSIGVAECLVGDEAQQWLGRADRALYRAKEEGRNRVCFAPESPEETDAASSVNPFMKVVWRDSYSSGNELIDSDHRYLFATANELLNAIATDQPRGHIGYMAHQLLVEIQNHFGREEQLLQQSGYGGLREHQQMHRVLLAKAIDTLDGFHADGNDAGPLFQFFAHDVLLKHLMGEDRKFFSALGQDAAH